MMTRAKLWEIQCGTTTKSKKKLKFHLISLLVFSFCIQREIPPCRRYNYEQMILIESNWTLSSVWNHFFFVLLFFFLFLLLVLVDCCFHQWNKYFYLYLALRFQPTRVSISHHSNSDKKMPTIVRTPPLC